MAALIMKARLYPLLSASALLWPSAASVFVCAVAIVASAASPMEPPTCRAVFSTPEAIPAWFGGTPDVAAAASGVKDSPTPNVVRTAPPRTPFAYVLVDESWDIHKNPAAEQSIPITRIGRPP